MDITYSWEIISMRKVATLANLSDVVVHLVWSKKGVDEDGNEGRFLGAMELPAPNAESFVPFADLTEADVLAWVQPTVTGGYAEHVDRQIAQQIAEKRQELTEVTVFPWSPAPTEPPVTP